MVLFHPAPGPDPELLLSAYPAMPMAIHDAQLSVLMIAGGILGVIAWIGYVMATTKPSPASITSED